MEHFQLLWMFQDISDFMLFNDASSAKPQAPKEPQVILEKALCATSKHFVVESTDINLEKAVALINELTKTFQEKPNPAQFYSCYAQYSPKAAFYFGLVQPCAALLLIKVFDAIVEDQSSSCCSLSTSSEIEVSEREAGNFCYRMRPDKACIYILYNLIVNDLIE